MIDCPFCTLRPEQVVASTPDALLIRALGDYDDYLVIPRNHEDWIQDLPATFMADLAILLESIPWWNADADFNISLNYGRPAGQRIMHLHWWIIKRSGETDGLGLATLLTEHGLR